MSKKSEARQRFVAMVKVTIDTMVPLRAKSFEDAIVEARALKEKDVVEFDTDFNDGSIEVSGILDDSVK